jgi:histone deacetylase complex subunit SAP18
MSDSAKIDRQSTTPFLLRLFYKTGSFHTVDDFHPGNHSLPPHVQIYTWKSCTLQEISTLLISALPSLLPEQSIGSRLCFKLFYPDQNERSRGRDGYSRYLSRDIGNVIVGGHPSTLITREAEESNQEDGKQEKSKTLYEGDTDVTLAEVKFVIGDLISCAVMAPSANGDVVPTPLEARGPRFGARENGFGGGYRGGDRRSGPRGDGTRHLPPGDWRRGDLPLGGRPR